MAVTTTSILSNEVQDAYSAMFEYQFHKKLTFAQFGKGKVWSASDNDPFRSNVVQFPIGTNLNLDNGALSETADPTAKSLNSSLVSITAQEYGEIVSTTSKLELTAYTDVHDEAVTQVSRAAAFKEDIVARDAFDNQTGAAYVTYVGQTALASITSTDLITPTIVSQTAARLKGAGVTGVGKSVEPNMKLNEDNHYVMLVHPHVALDFRTNPASNVWEDTSSYQDKMALFNWESGMWSGIRMIETDMCTVDYDAGAGNTTDIDGAQVAGATAIDVTSATGIAAGNTMSITTAGVKYTYDVVSVSVNEVTIGNCIAVDNVPYFTQTAGLVVDCVDTDAVASGVDVYTSYVLGYQAIGNAIVKPTAPTITKPSGGLERQTDFGFYGLFGYGEVRAESLHKIFSASSIGKN